MKLTKVDLIEENAKLRAKCDKYEMQILKLRFALEDIVDSSLFKWSIKYNRKTIAQKALNEIT